MAAFTWGGGALMKKKTKTPDQDNRSSDRALNPRSAEYEVGVLTTRRSVHFDAVQCGKCEDIIRRALRNVGKYVLDYMT